MLPLAEHFDILLSHVGITGLDERRPRGFLRYIPEDFLLEEVHVDGIASVRPTRSVPDDHQHSRRVLHCHLIKRGLSTRDAVERLCEAAGHASSDITHAENKEANAITSQRIGIVGGDWDRLRALRLPGMALEPVAYRQDPVSAGSHIGNRFTVHVRTDGTESKKHVAVLQELLAIGVKNLAPLFRFGKRLLDAKLGCFLCRGQEAETLRAYRLDPGPLSRSLPTSGVSSVFDLPDQARQWVRAYEAWVRNRYLCANNRPPTSLPSLFSEEGQETYRSLLAFDGTEKFLDTLACYRFLRLKPREISSRIVPEVHRIEKTDEGVLFSMTLPPGVHAATVLLPWYRLQEARPVPGWVRG